MLARSLVTPPFQKFDALPLRAFSTDARHAALCFRGASTLRFWPRCASPESFALSSAVNCNEYVEAYYAAAKVGATFVPLNYRAKHEELTYMINTSDVSVLFVGERYLDLVSQLRPKLTGIEQLVCYEKTVEGMGEFSKIIAEASPDEPFVDVDESKPTVLIYTSGTTSVPKGVALTYLNLSVYVTNTMSPADPGEEPDVTLLSASWIASAFSGPP